MRVAWLLVLPALVLASERAEAQLTQACEGESWAELAERRYADARLGKVVALYNRQGSAERCTAGRFVRLPSAIRHEVRLGQTLEAVASRFCRGPGGAALIRAKNGLVEGAQPDAETELLVPAELEISLGSRPEAELAEIPGLPELEVIRAYNGLKPGEKLKAGGTIYVPLFVEPAALAPSAGGEGGGGSDAGVDDAGKFAPRPQARRVAGEAAVPLLRVAVAARFDRFRHDLHRDVWGEAWRCNTCHLDDPLAKGRYQPIPTGLCEGCHTGFVATDAVQRTHRLALEYSHDLHLDPQRKVARAGYELTCATCHPAAAGSGLQKLPGHAECVKCHNPSEASPTVAQDCEGCHARGEGLDRLRAARALLDEHFRQSERGTDVHFSHESHLALAATPEASCDRCHLGARKADRLEQIEPQRMADCLTCHRGLEKTMGEAQRSLGTCQTCHFATRAGHMPVLSAVLEKPVSHTPTFRARHATQAAADDGVCSACHTELAGSPGGACDRCHNQLRPRDHTPRWREEPHGRSAARNPDRCATCHQRDRCADCHNVAPRDHFPRQAFELRHGRQARVSMRRCQTCHLPQADCARCHDVGGL